MKMLPVFLLLLAVFVSSSHQQCFTDNDAIKPLRPDQLRMWTNIGHKFSAALFKELDIERTKRDSNLIFSPWSIQHILLTAYFGAERETDQSLARVLQLPRGQRKSLTWQFYDYDRSMNDLHKSPLKIANKIFLRESLILRGCIQEKLRNEVELIDFYKDQEWAKKYINDWVSERTDGKITDLVSEFLQYSSGIIVNAAFFKGKWQRQFDPRRTNKDGTFSANYHTFSRVSLMRRSGYYQHGYCPGLGARTLLLPYSDNRTAMILLFPDRDLDVMMDLMDGNNLRYVTDRSKYETTFLSVELPKFQSKNSTNLYEAMKRFGSGKALTVYGDYSGFTGKSEVTFTGLEHEAMIEVDEEGATATAPNEITSRSANANLDFKFTRPFAYIIYDFTLNKVLFMGTFRKPVND